MVSHALLVHLEAQRGKSPALEQFLRDALPIVEGEPNTLAWFALKFGRSDYGIFDAFPDEEARIGHLSGHVPAALQAVANELLAEPPRIEPVTVLAGTFHAEGPALSDTKALLLKFKAKSRRNRLLGQWAAAKLGLSGADVDEYIKAVRKADLAQKGDNDVFQKIKKDLSDKGVGIPDAELRKTMDEFLAEAAQQIQAEAKS